MPNRYRTSDEIVVSRLIDGKETKLQLVDMELFACGAFSNVYRGIALTESNQRADIVVKKTWQRQKGTVSEVKCSLNSVSLAALRVMGEKLNRFKHKNIVRLLYTYQKEYGGKICRALIFEYIPLNLHQYLRQNNRKIGIVDVKMITWQLFRAQFHLQRMDICHRDVKPQNLLFEDESGLLKVSDFGSSAVDPRTAPQPSYHVTRYYRPPELLLGSRCYGPEIDIWSCGCVFGELLKGGIFLAGRNPNNQIDLIFDLIGRPSSEDLQIMRVDEKKYIEILQGYSDGESVTANFLYLSNQTPQNRRDRKTAVFNTCIEMKDMVESVEILRKILIYNPLKRLCGTELLLNPYFNELFLENTVRSNGRQIKCLSIQDLNSVKHGDKTVTGESTEDF